MAGVLQQPQEMADVQLEYFKKKTEELITNLPQPKVEPIKTLEDALENWEGKNKREEFKIKTVKGTRYLENCTENGKLQLNRI